MTTPPETIAELRKLLPKGFACGLESRALMTYSVHVWRWSLNGHPFDADFYFNHMANKAANIAAAYAAVCAIAEEI